MLLALTTKPVAAFFTVHWFYFIIKYGKIILSKHCVTHEDLNFNIVFFVNFWKK